MRKALKWSVLLVAILALTGITAFAAQGGGLQGKVVDEAGNPIIGATIRVTGPALQGFQGTATDTNGQYIIPYLPVGTNYQVKVEAQGYSTYVRKDVEIPLGTTVTLSFTLNQGSKEIVVKGVAPIIDAKKTEVGANFSDQMIQSIPLQRNSAGIAFLAPGAVSSGLADTPSLSGASGPENNYTVDGVDITGAGNGLNNTGLNFDFIQATEVKTGGLDAEFGALTGGAVSSITKSGGDEFHGSLFAYYFDDDMGAKERKLRNPTIMDYRKSFKQYDIGGSLGGYIVPEKLWFFASYDWNKTELGRTANGTDANVVLRGQPSYSWARATGYENDDENPMYATKLTWNINENHKLALSWFGNSDDYDYFGSLSNPNPTASHRQERVFNYAVSLQWNAMWTPRFFTEAIVSERSTREHDHPTNAAAENNYRYYYRYGNSTYGGYQIIPTGANGGYTKTGALNVLTYQPSLGGGYDEDTKDVNDQLRLKGTFLFDWAGHHELSAGYQYYDITYDYDFNYTGPGVKQTAWPFINLDTGAYINNPWAGTVSPGGAVVRWQESGGGYLYRAQYFMNDQAKKTKQNYYAYWAQDNWNLTDYFMLKLGVRLDQIHMKGGDNTLNVPDQLQPGHGYSNGKARHVNINDMWAPRIGFTWDIAHNQKSKLYGFWGQYYERIPNDMAIRALTDEYFDFTYFANPQLTVPVLGYAYGFLPTQITGGPNGGKLKGSYNEETILGFQYEVRPDLSLGVRGIYRALGRIIEDISTDGAASYIVTNPGNWTNVWVPDPDGRVDGNGNPYRWRFPKPVRIYKALELTVNKRFSNRWMMQGSYVLSRLQGNYEGLFSNDNGQLDPNITSKYDLPQLLKNAYGLLPNDRTNVLHLFGGYFFESIPLELSGNFTLMSGRPISALGADNDYGVNEGFVYRRGTAGRMPTTWALDLGAQYTFKIWNSNLGLRADIFNVTNEQRTTNVNETYNDVNTNPTPVYKYFGMETAHQQARRVRLALRWTF